MEESYNKTGDTIKLSIVAAIVICGGIGVWYWKAHSKQQSFQEATAPVAGGRTVIKNVADQGKELKGD